MLHALLHFITYLLGTMKKKKNCCPLFIWIIRAFFDKHRPKTITLPAPSLFDLSVGKYLVPLEAIHAYRNPTSATEPESEPQVDPPRQSNYQWDPEVIANQWHSEASS